MRFLARLLPAFAACALLASCQNAGQKPGDPYVSNYGNDGGYNPYPGQPGTVQSGGYSPEPAAPATPTYSRPPAPPPSDPYAFSPPSGSSSSSATASAPRKPTSTTASASKPKPKAKAPVKRSSSHKVVSGDTLYGIALNRGSTVAKIKAANKLTSDLIRPGQMLKIP